MVTANELLMSAGARAAAFPTIGTTITGTICAEPKVQQQTDIDSGTPLTFPNGDPRLQILVPLQTTLSEGEDDDGIRTLYAKANMLKALREAVVASGASGLEVGGQVTVTYSGDGAATRRGYNAPKLYTATYRPPTANANAANAALGLASPQPQPAAPNRTQPAHSPSPAASTPAASVSAEVWAALNTAQQAALIASGVTVPAAPGIPAPPGMDPGVWAALTPQQQTMLLSSTNPPY